MWLTMLGGLVVSVTGVYLGVRRIRSDVAMLRRPFRRADNARRSERQAAS